MHADQGDAMELRARAQQYTGPSAGRIANLIPQRVSFERGWFWTSTAICHGGESDGLAFRQRPDGNGIDVRCHTGGCIAGHIITELEVLIGLPIWTAYEPVGEVVAGTPRRRWPARRLGLAAVAVLLAVPLLLGHGAELTVLNAAGLGFGALLVRRFAVGRPARRTYRR